MNLKLILSEQKAEIDAVDINGLYPRAEEKEVNLDSNLAQVVIGVRRSGKSTLCQKVLLESGVNFAYVNFDDERLSTLKTEQLADVLEELYHIYGNFTHLFLDEVQNVSGWHLFVNRLLRMKLKILITGSNANLLSGELSTHLTGRYHQIELFPFSFLEYCNSKNVDTLKYTSQAIGLRKRYLEQYLVQGGFPELILNNNQPDFVKSLLSAIVRKDVCARYKIRYKETLWTVANVLLDNFCQEISLNALANQVQIKSVHTLKNYITFLCNAYLMAEVPIYSFKSKERQQSRKCYAIDMSFISGHENVLQPENAGWRLENAVALELMRRMHKDYEQLFYIRRTKDFEVDFATVSMGKVRELVQVTYDFYEPDTKQRNRELGGLIKGAQLTGCNNLTLIMMFGKQEDVEINGFVIKKVLASEWLVNRG